MAELVFDGVVRRNANSDTASVHTDMGDVTITLNHADDGEGHKIEFAMVMWHPADSPPGSLPLPFFVDPTTPLFTKIKTALQGESITANQAIDIVQEAQDLSQPEMQLEPPLPRIQKAEVQGQGTKMG